MSATAEKSHEDPATTRLSIATLEVLENLYERIKEVADRHAADEMEAEGSDRINPLWRDEFARQIINTAAGILSEKTNHLHQLQTEYLTYHLGIDTDKSA